MTELESLMSLNLLPEMPSIKFKRLWDYFGSGLKIIGASKKELKEAGITDLLADRIGKCRDASVGKEIDLIKKHKVEVITLKDKNYPENLKNISDPPVVLYIKGSLSNKDNNSIAIVGSRRASFYGISCAEKFSRGLAELGITIVSGMARGIDTASHQAALSAKGRTIAVLGSGLSNIYPPENKDLFNRIAENGAVISEFPMEAKPLAYHFPRRNRIISGLSLGTVVVEAARNSGALITANCALEQNREVFAVPGKVDGFNSKGVNELIKQGAKLTERVEDILEELNLKLKTNQSRLSPPADRPAASGVKILSQEQRLIFGLLNKIPRHIDEIISESRLGLPRVMAGLVQLEMLHLVKQLPGKVFSKRDG